MAIKNVEFSFLGDNYKAEYDRESGAYVAQVDAGKQTSWYAKNHTISANAAATGSERDPRDGTLYTARYSEKQVPELAIRVLEISAPVGEFLYPSEIPWIPYISENQPTLKFEFSDGSSVTFDPEEIDFNGVEFYKDPDMPTVQSGINLSTFELYLDDEKLYNYQYEIAEDESEKGHYNVSFLVRKVLKDGFHTVRFVVDDNDGNELDKEFRFNVVTTGPIILLNTVKDQMRTNKYSLDILGVTNDKWSFPTTMTVNGIEAEIDRESGIFSVTVPLENEGDNKITFVAVDELERVTTLEIIVVRDTTPPSINEVYIDPNPVDIGDTFTIRVDVTDD